MPVVVVESPAKARTINKYLGDDYTVLASYGHVRDLPAKDGSVDPDHGFAMQWEVAPESKKHLRAISEALKSDDSLILATDPDREGEAISWHLTEALAKDLKKGKKVSRVTFNAITKSAVTAAMKTPREVDLALVDAYLARRALDYLVGFNISPVLWRKLPGARSAGRVQSVCLRLIVEREMEIEAFRPREYWTVEATFLTTRGESYVARLSVLGGKKLDRFDLATQAEAELALQAVVSRTLAVLAVEAKPLSRSPAPPFMTSTLQQEASRKFGLGAKATMAAAQRLYEAGLITYMRTDGIDMAPEAISAAREAIAERFGAEYLPERPRIYKNKVKNAQEAHECIRPTDMRLAPERLRVSDADQRRLYELIWKRTLASQMAGARLERTIVDVGDDARQVGLRATGQVVLFDGFLRIYAEGRDDHPDEEEDSARLPKVAMGEPAPLAAGAFTARHAELAAADKPALLSPEGAVLAEQHHTQPPPRYTEAGLVKRMEELGIGRPSTYASIVSTIQDRGYVRREQNRLIPEDKGRLVTIFLMTWFAKYVAYDFTAGLEEELDDIASGERRWQEVLSRFWSDFSAALGETSELRISEVLAKIDEVLAPHLYPPRADGSDPRICPLCHKGRLSLRTARSGGAFIGCSNYPDCRYTRSLAVGEQDADAAIGPDGRLLGDDDGEPITLRSGRFGPYVQRGEASAEAPKPPRASLPKGWDPAALTLERALALLALPRQVGLHPDDAVPVEAGIGRYGPFLRHGATYANLATVEDVFEIGMNRAVEVLAQKAARGGRVAAAPLRELGEHPDGGPVQVLSGRYGPYVKWQKLNATLPRDVEPETVTLERAVELLTAKAAAGGRKKPTRRKSAAAGNGAAATKATTRAGAKPRSGAAGKRTARGSRATPPET